MLHWRPHWQLCGGFNKVGDVVGEASYESDIPKSTMCNDKVSGARFEGCPCTRQRQFAMSRRARMGPPRQFRLMLKVSNSLRVPSSLF